MASFHMQINMTYQTEINFFFFKFCTGETPKIRIKLCHHKGGHDSSLRIKKRDTLGEYLVPTKNVLGDKHCALVLAVIFFLSHLLYNT